MKPLPLMILAAACLPIPAQASDDRAADRAAAILSDPVQQEQLAHTVSMLMEAMMAVNVGPLADVIGKADPQSDARNIPADATLGEIMGRDPDEARMMGDQVRASTRMAGAAASALGAYMPVLKDMARDVAAQVEQNMRNASK